MRVTLDTNCFIDAMNPSSHAHAPMTRIFATNRAHLLELTVSRHTIAELEQKPDAALATARACVVLPPYPVGSWDEQVATWEQAAGTWADAKQNQAFQQQLKALAKSGNDIRDRGAYIDALWARVDAFITSDTQLAGSAPAKLIEARFGLRVLRPHDLVVEVGL